MSLMGVPGGINAAARGLGDDAGSVDLSTFLAQAAAQEATLPADPVQQANMCTIW